MLRPPCFSNTVNCEYNINIIVRNNNSLQSRGSCHCEYIKTATSTSPTDVRRRLTSDITTDDRHCVRQLSRLHNGDPVLLKLDDQKRWSTPSTVVRSDPRNRSYVSTDDICRGRRTPSSTTTLTTMTMTNTMT